MRTLICLLIILLPTTGMSGSASGYGEGGSESSDLWQFAPNVTQEGMLEFLNEFGWHSQAGRYWIVLGPIEKYFGLKLYRTSYSTDAFADKNGNILTVLWSEHNPSNLDVQHSQMISSVVSRYRVQWPDCNIKQTVAQRLLVNGNTAKRTILDVTDEYSGNTLRAYGVTIIGPDRGYTLLLVHQHEKPGMKGSRDVDYWNEYFHHMMELTLLGFLPVDKEGNLPRQHKQDRKTVSEYD